MFEAYKLQNDKNYSDFDESFSDFQRLDSLNRSFQK